MEGWEICENSQINIQSPYQSLEPLIWDNTMAMRSESELINQSFSVCSEFSDKEQYWTPFQNEDDHGSCKRDNQGEKTEEAIRVHSPMVAGIHSASASALDEQHSEILCAEEHQSDSGSKKSSEGEIVESKKRKRSTERGPKYAFKTRSDTDVLEDGFKWRKYGKKTIKSSPHPRSYYRCSDSNCGVKKRVERDPADEGVLITTYDGKHNHDTPSIIYYIGNPFIVHRPAPASKPAILLLNTGFC